MRVAACCWITNRGSTTVAARAARGDEAWKEHVLGLFAGDLPDVSTILEATGPERFRPIGTYDLASLPRWSRGRVALLGDAAHAVSNSSGQGASLAAEDALVLASCLRDLPTAEEAFAAYEQHRRDRVERVAAEGRRRGNQKLGSSNPAALLMRDLTLRVVFAVIARFGSQAWMNDYRVDFERRVTAPLPSPR